MLAAAIFDLDGLLLDSEPLWREAEIAIFAEVGVELDDEMCRQTMGLRLDEVVDHWHERFPWEEPSPAELAERVVDRVAGLVVERGQLRPGARQVLDVVRERGLLVALASSSCYRLIHTVLDRFDLGGQFGVVHSAEDEELGKPHPGIYLTTARKLGVAPPRCLALEDSLNGVLAAKAARMRCIAVPETFDGHDERLVVADLVVPSLLDVDDEVLAGMDSAERGWGPRLGEEPGVVGVPAGTSGSGGVMRPRRGR